MKLFVLGFLFFAFEIEGVINNAKDGESVLSPIKSTQLEKDSSTSFLSLLIHAIPTQTAITTTIPAQYQIVIALYGLLALITLISCGFMISNKAWTSNAPFVDPPARLFSVSHFIMAAIMALKAIALADHISELSSSSNPNNSNLKFIYFVRTFFLIGEFCCFLFLASYTTFHAAPMKWITAAQKTVDKPCAHPLILIPTLLLLIPAVMGLILLYYVMFWVSSNNVSDRFKEEIAKHSLISVSVLILCCNICFIIIGIYSVHRAYKWWANGDNTVLPGLIRNVVFTLITAAFGFQCLLTVGLLGENQLSLVDNPGHIIFYGCDLLCILFLVLASYRRTAWQKHQNQRLSQQEISYEEKSHNRQQEIADQKKARERRQTALLKNSAQNEERSLVKSPEPPTTHKTPPADGWVVPDRIPPLPPKPGEPIPPERSPQSSQYSIPSQPPPPPPGGSWSPASSDGSLLDEGTDFGRPPSLSDDGTPLLGAEEDNKRTPLANLTYPSETRNTGTKKQESDVHYDVVSPYW